MCQIDQTMEVKGQQAGDWAECLAFLSVLRNICPHKAACNMSYIYASLRDKHDSSRSRTYSLPEIETTHLQSVHHNPYIPLLQHDQLQLHRLNRRVRFAFLARVPCQLVWAHVQVPARQFCGHCLHLQGVQGHVQPARRSDSVLHHRGMFQ